MTVRVFLWGSFLASLVFWGIWFLVVAWIDPAEAEVIGFTMFFMTFFLAVASTISFLGYGIRRLISPAQLAAYRVRTSLRQGVWLGLLINLLLMLQLQRLLRWWVTLIVVILFLSLELLFLTYDKSTSRHQRTSPEGSSRA
ncbi:MAG: hypothetical protein HYZ61_01615 [Candidatus Andersenbacteria bacterium]|nr:hypothetical protein [Candidatus Andersenbacteria bacterium]